MKGVVVQVQGRSAAVLTDDGCVKKIKNHSYETGQVILMKSVVSVKSVRRAAAAAAAAAVVLACSVGAYAYTVPCSYVSLDVNPSLEFSLNRFDRVLSVSGVNEDGKKLLEEVPLDSLSNKSIDEAIAETIRIIGEAGFFEADADGIVIAASAKDIKKAERLEAQLEKSAKEAAGDKAEVETLAVGRERVLEARELGVTPGKLNLVEKLRDSAENPGDVDLEEWLEKPVQEIMSRIKENRAAEKAGGKEEEARGFREEKQNAGCEGDRARTEAMEQEKLQKAKEKAGREAQRTEEKLQKAEEKAEKKALHKAEKQNSK